MFLLSRCCWYHKGTNFQANHNPAFEALISHQVVADTTKVRIFKQITTLDSLLNAGVKLLLIPQRYEFSSKSQQVLLLTLLVLVVADTTKVRIFKQITTSAASSVITKGLLLIPQRYEFSSKSQLTWCSMLNYAGCCWYHKGTNFQANHNQSQSLSDDVRVVADTTKVRIFKQITTTCQRWQCWYRLLLIPQRYEFSSKSQLRNLALTLQMRCCWYHKGTNFQANHNCFEYGKKTKRVVADTTKVRIFKQITTALVSGQYVSTLLLIPQRYEFSSKSQPRH